MLLLIPSSNREALPTVIDVINVCFGQGDEDACSNNSVLDVDSCVGVVTNGDRAELKTEYNSKSS